MEASRPEDTETEGAEVDYGPWTARKRFRAEYVVFEIPLYCRLRNFIVEKHAR